MERAAPAPASAALATPPDPSGGQLFLHRRLPCGRLAEIPPELQHGHLLVADQRKRRETLSADLAEQCAALVDVFVRRFAGEGRIGGFERSTVESDVDGELAQYRLVGDLATLDEMGALDALQQIEAP